MTIRRSVQALLTGALLLAVAGAVIVLMASANNRALVESQRQRFESFRLAEELRQSSDDLTRFARTYVITGDSTFEQSYWNVLAVLTGDATTASLLQRLQRTGITSEEMAKLADAHARSALLARIESAALHAIKGEFADDSGGFTRHGPPDQAWAVRVMHDAAYHREKALIMKPIDEVIAMLDTRTASSVASFARRSTVYWRLIEVTAVLFVGLLVVAYPLARRRVFEPIAALQRQTTMVAVDLGRLAEVATQNAQGDRQPWVGASTAPLGLTRRDEVGELSRLHDTMIGQLQVTGASIAKMTADLSQAHADLMAIIDIVPAALIALNADRTWRLENKAAVALLGIPPLDRDARLRYFATFAFRDKSSRSLAIDELPPVRALAGIETVGQEIEVERADGLKAVVLSAATPLRDAQGHITGAISVFQDISRLRELDRMKDEFVAIVSHELRTPLTAIRGSLQLLLAEDAVPDPENRELLEVGLASCERLVRIINDMLDISKIEAGKLELRIAPIDVGELVERAIAGVEALAREASVTVGRDVDPELPVLRGDSDRLTQALVNLVSNAIKFAPRGSAVTVSAGATAEGVALRVSDRGPGIAEADLAKLFRKFQQLADPATRRAGGTGLGLSITKAIVEQHGGTVAVNSTVGQGTTFILTVPLGPDAAPA